MTITPMVGGISYDYKALKMTDLAIVCTLVVFHNHDLIFIDLSWFEEQHDTT